MHCGIRIIFLFFLTCSSGLLQTFAFSYKYSHSQCLRLIKARYSHVDIIRKQYRSDALGTKSDGLGCLIEENKNLQTKLHYGKSDGSDKVNEIKSYQSLSLNSNYDTFASLPSPDTIAILAIYFVQGALGLSRLALTYFLKDNLHLSPADAAALIGLTTLPWVIKPVYGFLSDGFPLFGYKRRSYLIAAGIVGSLSWLAMASLVSTKESALFFTLVGSAAVAVSDVVADSIVVEKTRDTVLLKIDNENGESNTTSSSIAKDLQSLCWASASVGGILSAYFSGSLLMTISTQTVFCFTAAFPLITSLSAFLIDEEKVTPSLSPNEEKESLMKQPSAVFQTSQTQISKIIDTFKEPRIYLPVLFIFCWQATPSPDSAMFYLYTNELGFTPEFLGKVRLVSSIAALIGVVIYRTTLKDFKIKDVIFWSTIISVPLSLTQLLLTTHYNRVLGIPDQLFVLTDSVVLTVLGQVAFMPLLALASLLCPPGVEGTLFATLMSIYNSAGIVSNELGASLTSYMKVTESDFTNLSLLVLICSLSALLPLPFMDSMFFEEDAK